LLIDLRPVKLTEEQLVDEKKNLIGQGKRLKKTVEYLKDSLRGDNGTLKKLQMEEAVTSVKLSTVDATTTLMKDAHHHFQTVQKKKLLSAFGSILSTFDEIEKSLEHI